MVASERQSGISPSAGYDKSLAAECPLSPADNRREVRIAERTCRGWLWGRGQGEGPPLGTRPAVQNPAKRRVAARCVTPERRTHMNADGSHGSGICTPRQTGLAPLTLPSPPTRWPTGTYPKPRLLGHRFGGEGTLMPPTPFTSVR